MRIIILLLVQLFVTEAHAKGTLKEALEEKISEDTGIAPIYLKIVTPLPSHKEVRLLKVYRAVGGQFIALVSIDGKEKELKLQYSQAKCIVAPKYKVNKEGSLKEDNLTFIKIPLTQFKEGYVTSIKEVTDKIARRNLQAMKPIKTKDLKSSINLVNPGNKLLMVFEETPLKITAEGVAIDSGGLGDFIRVKNLTSNKIVKGKVIGQGKVQFNNFQ